MIYIIAIIGVLVIGKWDKDPNKNLFKIILLSLLSLALFLQATIIGIH